jgi:MFS family permease
MDVRHGILPAFNSAVMNKFPALSHRNFRYFLYGQAISIIGTWMQKTAQQWVVYDITKSPLMLGLVGVFQFAPMLVFSLFAGVLADRFPKKKFLMVTQSIQMIQALLLAILILSGRIHIWHILVLSGILGLAQTFDMPARQTFFIELVGRDNLVSAIGLNSTIVNLGRIIGPAMAGILLVCFGASFCFLMNALSFIAVLLGLFMIKQDSLFTRKRSGNVFYEIKAGVKYVFSSDIISTAVLSMLIVGIFAMNTDVLLPVLAKVAFNRNAGGFSIMIMAMGIGCLAGSLLFTLRIFGGLDKKFLLISAFLLSFFSMAAGFINNYYFSLLLIAMIGFFQMLYMTGTNSIIQMNSSDEFRGRAVSIYSLVFVGTTPVGNFLAGLIMKRHGPGYCFVVFGILTIVTVIPVYLLKYLLKFRKQKIVAENTEL